MRAKGNPVAQKASPTTALRAIAATDIRFMLGTPNGIGMSGNPMSPPHPSQQKHTTLGASGQHVKPAQCRGWALTFLPSSIYVTNWFWLGFRVTNQGEAASPSTSISPAIRNVPDTWSAGCLSILCTTARAGRERHPASAEVFQLDQPQFPCVRALCPSSVSSASGTCLSVDRQAPRLRYIGITRYPTGGRPVTK